MADSIITKLLTALTAKTSADDTDIIPVGSSDSNLFKMTFENLRKALLGDATLNTSAQTIIGAINENKSSINTLNTNLTVTTTGVVTLSSGIDYQAWKYGRIVVLKVHNWGKVTLSSGATIATLDTAYRPISDVAWAHNGVDTYNGSITVTTGGAIQYMSWGGTSNYIYAQMTYISAS